MDRDERPANALQDVRDLQNDVREVAGAASQRPAITKASKGWELPSTSTPPTPASGGHLYASGGTPMWRSSTGAIIDLTPPPPLTPGSDPGTMPGLSTPNAWPETYNPLNGESVQDDLVMLRDYCHALRAALVTAGVLA